MSITVSICWVPMSVPADRATLLQQMVSIAMVCYNHLAIKMINIGHNIDINECQINGGGCEHNCSNTDGSFMCLCQQGFSLASDGLLCDGKKLLHSYVHYYVHGQTYKF